MKNITITLPEKAARWVRVWAAEHDTSVSKFLSGLIQERMEAETEYRQAKDRFLRRSPRPLRKPGAPYPSRESLHER